MMSPSGELTTERSLLAVFKGIGTGEGPTLPETAWVACNGEAALPFCELEREQGSGVHGGISWAAFRQSFTEDAFRGVAPSIATTLCVHRLDALSAALQKRLDDDADEEDGYQRAQDCLRSTSAEQGWLWLGKVGHKGKIEWSEGHCGLWPGEQGGAYLIFGQEHLPLESTVLEYDDANPEQISVRHGDAITGLQWVLYHPHREVVREWFLRLLRAQCKLYPAKANKLCIYT